jgi:hypothetical protein
MGSIAYSLYSVVCGKIQGDKSGRFAPAFAVVFMVIDNIPAA